MWPHPDSNLVNFNRNPDNYRNMRPWNEDMRTVNTKGHRILREDKDLQYWSRPLEGIEGGAGIGLHAEVSVTYTQQCYNKI